MRTKSRVVHHEPDAQARASLSTTVCPCLRVGLVVENVGRASRWPVNADAERGKPEACPTFFNGLLDRTSSPVPRRFADSQRDEVVVARLAEEEFFRHGDEVGRFQEDLIERQHGGETEVTPRCVRLAEQQQKLPGL